MTLKTIPMTFEGTELCRGKLRSRIPMLIAPGTSLPAGQTLRNSAASTFTADVFGRRVRLVGESAEKESFTLLDALRSSCAF